MKKSILSKLFATVALGMTCVAAWAVKPEAGKVYRIVNKGYANYVMAAQGTANGIACSLQNATNDSQLWLAVSNSTEGTLSFRSLGVGTYLRSSNAQSSQWSLGMNTSNKATHMVISASAGSYTIKAVNGTGDYVYAHCDASKNVVGWTNSIDPSRWDFSLVDLTQEEIDRKLAATEDLLGEQKNEGKYQELLKKIFTDDACTVLNSTFAGMTEAQIKANEDFKALPEALRNAVLKVKSGDWSETDPTDASKEWDSTHAKKYRVQMIEPYSPGSEAAQLCGIQAYTNMNNPTGILSDSGTNLYVMVEGLPDEGCTMYMNGCTGSGMWNDYRAGVELHNGLNVVPGWSDTAHQFIYYTVNTVTPTAQSDGRFHPTEYKVTEFPDVKVHIEGGSINGFFNYLGDELYAPDTTEDFWYTANRARHEMYSLLGKYVILYFFLEDTPSKVGNTTKSWGLKSVMNPANAPKNETYAGRTYDLTEIMKVWDDMCWSERVMMGVNSADNIKEFNDYYTNNNNNDCNFFTNIVGDEELVKGFKVAPQYSYHDYFNNRMMGITMQGDLFMNATWWRTAYNIGTLDAILCTIPYDSGSLWGPAHEYGHINQGPVKVAGTTEISNNCFSNVAVYYHNQTTSRSNHPIDMVKSFNNGDTYLDYGIWSTTRMYFQLFLYYHVAQHNTKFYPRLYELLRNHPLQKSYYLNPRYDALQFVRMCCLAAEEDLTNYFEAWGMFVPLKSYHIGDYSNFMATLTQEDIDAVKAEIKSWGFPENNQIIFIDDRPGQTKLDGKTSRRQWADYMSIEGAGTLGGVIDFRNKKAASGEMSFNLNGFNIEVVMGEGASAGVGFLVFSNDGKLLGFGNDLTFPVNSECAKALIEGTATVKAIGGDGKTVELANNFLTSDAATRLVELNKLIELVKPELNFVDEEKARAGYYMPYYAEPVNQAITAAKAMTAESNPNDISNAYIALVTAYNELRNNTAAKVSFMPGANYNILHNNFSTRCLGVNTKNAPASMTAKNKLDGDNNIWTFEVADAENDLYRLKNLKEGLESAYLGTGEKGDQLTLVKKSKAGQFKVQANGQGLYVMTLDNEWNKGVQIMNNTATGAIGLWSADDKNSQWILRLHDATAKGASLVALQQLVSDVKRDFPSAGDVAIEGDDIQLKAENMTSNAPYTGTAYPDDRFTSFDVLFDGDINTYFHSNYDNNAASTDGKNHNIAMDLGEGNETNSFQITWVNRTVNNNSGVHAPTSVRVEGSNDGKSWTLIQKLEDLPVGSGATYMSPIITSETAYRYIRIVVTASTSGSKYFVLAELNINHAQYKVTPNPVYPKMTEEIVMNVYNTLNDANSVLALSNPTQKKCDTAYEPLRAAYEAMMAAMDKEAAPELKYETESSILEITVDTEGVEGIYDLQGRRLNKASNGIFIVNGKKVLVK